MNLVQWNPLNEFDRLLGEPYLRRLATHSSEVVVDVFVNTGEMTAQANIPGLDVNKIEVSIDEDLLTISAHRDEERDSKNAKKEGYFLKEIWRGSFSRSIRLPRVVQAAKATAQYKNGVLTITMPINQKEADNQVKIPVTGA